MNILVLTSIHPMQIIETSELERTYSQYNNVYSIQSMALLKEAAIDDGYLYGQNNIIFATEIQNKPHLIIPKNKMYEHTIMYGNLDKRTNIKFDHVIALDSIYIDNGGTDPYLKILDVYDEVLTEEQRLQFYTINDAHITVPDMQHLHILLSTLGIKRNDDDDGEGQAPLEELENELQS